MQPSNVVPTFWNEYHDVRNGLLLNDVVLTRLPRYYIIYVFEGAGLTGRRGNLIADSVQYVLNVVLTGSCLPLVSSAYTDLIVTVPAIIYIDKWGRRPMLIIGTLLMGFWLMLVGGLQGRFGDWGLNGTDRK